MTLRCKLDQEALDTFWQFICERQRVWYRRVVLENEPPWTDDEILRQYRFTNVYRQLDPGTQYAIQHILERDESKPDKIFNVLIYRLIGRSETHEHVGFQRLDEFDPITFEEELKTRRDYQDEPVFTGAYMVSGYNQMGSSDKVENISRLFGEVKDLFDSFYESIEESEELKQVYHAIRDLPGFGNFLSYQVLVDLLYPLRTNNGNSLLPYSHNDWSSPGPGAQRGLEALLFDQEKRTYLEVMRWLQHHQVEEFDRLDLHFPYLQDSDGQRMELSLADIQNCLCEFYKYHKILHAEGRARRRFRIPNSRSPAELKTIYADYPVSLNPQHYAPPMPSD